jgi:hypothetical protein
MTELEKEMLSIIKGSNNPEMVANYFINLILDYLHTDVPSQERPFDVLQESS